MELPTQESYSKIHEGVLAALLQMGIEARLAPSCDPVESAACFQKAVKFDITDLAGRKLSGAAQRRTREGMLHQGSVLLPDPSRNGEFYGLLAQSMAGKLGIKWESSVLTGAESKRAATLETERYATDAWNKRL
jgi:lipoate-protein ligase A